jgi:hypothetical protein
VLSKILGSFLKRANKNDEAANIANLPKYAQARIALEKLVARKGKPFNPIRASAVEVQCINANIVTFIDRINNYHEKLESGIGLTPSDCFAEFKKISLDEFFTDEIGMYIPAATLFLFTAACTRLLDVIEQGVADKSRDVDYSVRLLSKCLTSIQNVCKAVEEAAN